MQGVKKEDFPMNKEWYKPALQRNDLWDILEDDLMNSQIINMHVGVCICIEKE